MYKFFQKILLCLSLSTLFAVFIITYARRDASPLQPYLFTARDGNGNTTIYRGIVGNRSITPIVTTHSSLSFIALSPDQQWIIYNEFAPPNNYSNFYRRHLYGRQVFPIVQEFGYTHLQGWGRITENWILLGFEDENELYNIESNGNLHRSLFFSNKNIRAPSPSGDWLYFLYNADIHRIHLGETESQNLTHTGTVSEFLGLSPDSTEIIFRANESNRPFLYRARTDGSLLQKLAPTPPFPISKVYWLPDKTGIIFLMSLENHDEWYSLNFENPEPQPLTNLVGFKHYFSRFVQEDLLIFENSSEPNLQIYAVSVEENMVINLTADFSHAEFLSLSPNEEWVLFQVPEVEYQIYRVRVDGTQLQPLYGSKYGSLYPQWSPDNQMIILHLASQNSYDDKLYALRFDGTPLQRLTNLPQDWNEDFATWLPAIDLKWNAGLVLGVSSLFLLLSLLPKPSFPRKP